MTTFQPADAAEAASAISWAAAEGQGLEIVAGGSKQRLGRPVLAGHTLDVSRLSGIVDYDPAELVLTAHAATPLRHIAPHLTDGRQMLAFEPPAWRALLGSTGEPTLGGVIACNLAGPRRVRAGAARDHLLGFSAVNGWGDEWKSGGRVVKNVTGYDMCKLQAGAFGTLSLLTQLSVRVVPRPDTACTLVLDGLSDTDGIAALMQALNSPYEVSAAAHLPAPVAQRAGLAAAATLLRLEGHAPSVVFRAAGLRALFKRGELIEATASEEVWTRVGEVAPLLDPVGRCIWRVCPTPSTAPGVVAAVRAALDSAAAFYDWGGGLVWISLDASQGGADGGAALVRQAVAPGGGHATLVVAPDAVRAAVAVFQPETGALAQLSGRVKASFDPQAVLNPGRVHSNSAPGSR